MAKIKVASTAENSLSFNIYDGDQARSFIKDAEGNVKNVYDNAIIKTVVIQGVHQYLEENKILANCALTDIDSKDWEYIQLAHKDNYYIKNKIVFAGKNEIETLAQVKAGESKEFKTGTEKYVVPTPKVA